MLEKCRRVDIMLLGGYRPHKHGEWIDAYNKSYNLDYCGTIALQTFMSNERFVVIEL